MKLITPDDAPIRNVYRLASGAYEIKVTVGSGANAVKNPYTDYPAGTPRAVLEQAVKDIRADLQRQYAAKEKRVANTLAATVAAFLDKATGLSDKQRKRYGHQLAYWCAQPAALAAEVVTPDVYFAARTAERERGVPMPARGRTLGDLGLTKLHLTSKGTPVVALSLPGEALDRIREVLDVAFAPSDPHTDPNEFGNTSNHYRRALVAVFKWANRNIANAPNPLSLVATRATDAASLAGQDMRIVRNILRRLDTGFGRPSRLGQLRLAVLAYVNITPDQLMRVEASNFYDKPNATRADILAGDVRLLKPARHKGRSKITPQPELIPLTPYGVEAMRALVAEPGAFARRSFSTSSLNKQWQRAVAREVAALTARGIPVPETLPTMTAYHLKHSLACALEIATAGKFDRSGRLRQAEETVAAYNHKRGRTSAIYTGASVAPVLIKANIALTEYLDEVFATPLAPAVELREVPTKGRAGRR
jgi:hypothetical protein